MHSILKRAKEIEKEIIGIRRAIHKNAEINSNLKVTAEFVKKKLTEINCENEEISECGITAVIGNSNKGKTILLRADMDALPMKEDNNLEYKSVTDYSHCCGHDMHTAMLLGAAKILKEIENDLNGAVKLMFQPDEEGGTGAKKMLDAGLLNSPIPKAALALHVDAKRPLNHLDYGIGCTFSSNDNFEIIVTGKGGHGARPHESIDPINIACHINLALQTLICRELNPAKTVILTISSIDAGSSFNIIPDKAILKGSLRTYDNEQRAYNIKRIDEICKLTAKAFKGEAKLIIHSSVPVLYCNRELTKEILKYSEEIFDIDKINSNPIVRMGSEDFSFISEKIKSSYLFIGAGVDEQNGSEYGQHSPKVIFNEDILYRGAALLAHCACMWLQNN